MALVGFGGDPIGRAEVEMREGKIKNGKAAVEDEIIGDMIKGEGDKVVDWIWRLCNMAFESGVVLEDWRSAVIIPLYKAKIEINECKNYIYAGILIESPQSDWGFD